MAKSGWALSVAPMPGQVVRVAQEWDRGGRDVMVDHVEHRLVGAFAHEDPPRQPARQRRHMRQRGDDRRAQLGGCRVEPELPRDLRDVLVGRAESEHGADRIARHQVQQQEHQPQYRQIQHSGITALPGELREYGAEHDDGFRVGETGEQALAKAPCKIVVQCVGTVQFQSGAGPLPVRQVQQVRNPHILDPATD